MADRQNRTVTVKVAHDYNCGWCWIGILQIERLQAEFGVEFELIPYELYPLEMEWPDAPPRPEPPANRPPTLSRFQLACYASGMAPPVQKGPPKLRTHNCHLATEFAKQEGVHLEYARRLYDAYWVEGTDISQVEELCRLAKGLVSDIAGLRESVNQEVFADRITEFNTPAYESGVYNVPTFFIGGQRYAEQPYAVLAAALQRELG